MKRDTLDSREQYDAIRLNTLVGELIIRGNDHAVCRIDLASADDAAIPETRPDNAALTQAANELKEYFAGVRTDFSFAMEPQGTAFQKEVWNELLKIPYGETATYGQIAMAIGNPKGARAVGMACNRNPIWIVVPCHRVVGASGALVGYALGTGMKRSLLELEHANQD
jgi:methylated-DNA-[protein]-cysteine S-methyltransferase